MPAAVKTLIKTAEKGFTLIELVIVIIILSIIGFATTTYISTGVNLYNDITERDKALSSMRFVMERLQREVANALPNSAEVSGECLTFFPIKSSSLYTDFPIYPLTASQGGILKDSAYDYAEGDKAVVYLLHETELTFVDTNGSKKVQNIIAVNSDKTKLTFSGEVSFPLASPAKRVYIINEQIQYCFSGDDLYRQVNDDTRVLMDQNITGSFAVLDSTLQRNSLVQVKFSLMFDEQEVAFERTLHINNVP